MTAALSLPNESRLSASTQSERPVDSESASVNLVPSLKTSATAPCTRVPAARAKLTWLPEPSDGTDRVSCVMSAVPEVTAASNEAVSTPLNVACTVKAPVPLARRP